MDRGAIDYEEAARQHQVYVEELRRLGAVPISLPALPDNPDSPFVEDTAVVLADVAVICNPRLPSRQSEVDSTACVLSEYRPIVRLEGDAHLEGGDVLRVGQQLYVGNSSRTNAEGIRQLGEAVEAHGYRVEAIPVEHCLHLKTGCTYIGEDTLLMNPRWIDPSLFPQFTHH